METASRSLDERDGNTSTSTSPSKQQHQFTRKRKIMDVGDANPLADRRIAAGRSKFAFNEFAWETSKENVMPLKRGRNVLELNKALCAQDSFQDKLRLEEHAKQLEAELQAYEGDDPLGLWLRYIHWIEEKMPEDTRKRFAVLEKCTRALTDDSRYTNDIRYIRVWIQYADLVSNPKDIFKYLYQNKIGEHVSLFYVGWAWVLESMGSYAQAHKVYMKATQKHAEPEDLLARKYKEFQRRMSRHWLKMNEASTNSHDSAQEVNQRVALESMSVHSAEFAGLVDANERQQQAFERAQKVKKANAHKPVFTVYEDPVGHEVDFFDSSADWRTLDTSRHQNKENEVAAGKWNQSMPRASDSASSRAAGAERPAAQPLQRIEGVATEEELLAKKPLKNFGHSHSKPAPATSTKASKSSKKDVKSERIGYDLELLKTETGDVLSFEEARARAYSARARRRVQAAPVQANQFLAAEQPSYSRPVNSFLDTNAALDTSVGFDEISRRLNFATTAKKASPRRSGIPAAQLASLDQAAQDDMTINTRVAMSEVNDMFCSPDREGEGKVWDIREEDPVERKLHFSVFDDSVESVAPSMHDQSVREDVPSLPASKQSFSIFVDDDAPAPPPTDSKAKSLHRKPLGSREDLLRSVRLTNKDVLMQLRDDKASDSDAPAKDARAPLKAPRPTGMRTVVTPEALTRRRATAVPDQPAPKKAKIVAEARTQPAALKKAPKAKAVVDAPVEPIDSELLPLPLPLPSLSLSLDPYKAENRRKMVHDARVREYLAARPDAVHFHSRKIPALPCQKPEKRKLKKPIALSLSSSFAVDVTGHLGSGAFAHVFAVTVNQESQSTCTMALKYEKHRSNLPWEFFVTNKIKTRLACATGSPADRSSPPIATFHRLDIFRDGCMLFMAKSPNGTLHDLLNCYKKLGQPFPESLAVYYTIKMLRAVELLHRAHVLHGDVKPDNWLVVPGCSESAVLQASRTDDNAPTKTQAKSAVFQTGDLALIDFGRAIDLTFFPRGTTFVGDCHTKGFQTPEMLACKPWTKQIDTFGVCATTHCMLFGDYMDVVCHKDSTGRARWSIKRTFKRYWAVEMWRDVFDELLNVKSCAEQPSLPHLCAKLEAFFATSPQRQQELHECLGRQERFGVASKL